MAEPHPLASAAAGPLAGETSLVPDDDALGFECAAPWLQIETWAAEQSAAAGNAESASRPI